MAGTPGSPGNPVPRRAARVLVVDGAGRVLMFRGFDPAHPDVKYWFTAGGGLEDGEDSAVGAARELAEETGLCVVPAQLGPVVWRQITEFAFDGRWYRQDQVFYLLRVDSLVVNTAGFDGTERRSIEAHRWWALPELLDTPERYYPVELPALLATILEA